jgi:transposase
MAKERRKYTKEYKESAGAMTERDDRTVGQAAREPGIDAGLRRGGRTEARKARDGTVKAFPGKGNPRDGELVRTRKRIAELEQENEILKKAAVIFAKETLR